MRWQVQLEGDPSDLEYLAGILGSGSRRIFRDPRGPGHLYESDALSSCMDSGQVATVVENEIAALSGILKLERHSRESLRHGAVYRLNSKGGRDIFVEIRESLFARVEIGAVTAVGSEGGGDLIPRTTPPPRELVLFNLTATDPAVEKTMRLLGAPDVYSWVGLYRLYEVIEDDVGGENALRAKGWAKSSELKRFRHSANSVQVGGDGSRHGKERKMPPLNPMTLAEAEAYLKSVVRAWLKEKLHEAT